MYEGREVLGKKRDFFEFHKAFRDDKRGVNKKAPVFITGAIN